MNTKPHIKSLVLGAFLGAAVLFSIGAATNQGNSKTWEYKTVEGWLNNANGEMLQTAINADVSKGWEFVCASGSGNQEIGFAVMKREKK